ncbi:MAG: SlyX family protein [Kordiimonadaceae bacterium]|nr:SlyX family protein [Kordiimonadaceae bacterium]
MSEISTLQRRLDDLECKFAFQQETLEALNTEVSKQWANIDALTKQLQRLTDHMMSSDTDTMEKTHDDPPPPHY